MSKFINPSLIILFGSRSKGSATEVSDYDIGVVANEPLSFEQKNKLSETVAKEFGYPEDKIEIVDLNEASPLLQMEAAKSGKLLKGSARTPFTRFETDSRKVKRLGAHVQKTGRHDGWMGSGWRCSKHENQHG